jgi:ribosome maturation factor RimP
VVVYKSGPSGGPPSLDECSRIHHAILPRLELAFPGADLFVEVSSPGIDRLIKDPAELGCYVGRGIRCYRTGTAEWVGGVLQSSDGAELSIKTQDGTITVPYAHIGKVKLDYSQEV